MHTLTLRVAALVLALVSFAPSAAHLERLHAGQVATRPSFPLGRPERVAPGIDLFRLDDPALLSPPGPVAIQLLRLDPRRVIVRSALANDEVLGLETVADTARRHRAVAAINAGFFLASGDPAGILKLRGNLISDTSLLRGAVAVTSGARTGTSLVFDRVSVALRLRTGDGGGRGTVEVDGIDTTRAPGRLVWFTPRFFDHTNTTTAGVDWVIRRTPPLVVERREAVMRTRIPRDGAVLSYGGTAPPPALARLEPGVRVDLLPVYTSGFGTPDAVFERASDIVGGAGLLMRLGRAIRDWTPERLGKGFDTTRHPRTMIGEDANGRIWLVTVDGRNPAISLGMNFDEMQRLAEALGLRNALNLDGGGSTTMVVRGRIVNHPSDPTGPRRVSDSLLVFTRRN